MPLWQALCFHTHGLVGTSFREMVVYSVVDPPIKCCISNRKVQKLVLIPPLLTTGLPTLFHTSESDQKLDGSLPSFQFARFPDNSLLVYTLLRSVGSLRSMYSVPRGRDYWTTAVFVRACYQPSRRTTMARPNLISITGEVYQFNRLVGLHELYRCCCYCHDGVMFVVHDDC